MQRFWMRRRSPPPLVSVVALASSSMAHLARLALRLVVGTAAVAGFAGFELRHAGALTAIAVSWSVFTSSVFAITAWGQIQLVRSERRMQSLRSRRSRRTQ
jgi:hypothetical protein